MTLHRRGPRSVNFALTPMRETWAPETVLAEVQRVWPAVVGEAIAAEAAPQRERAGVLTVTCSASVWAHELHLMAPVILERLNSQMHRGHITRLRCTTGAD
jgi:predicted nucleic acid-binding Zn ribbon protein